MIILVGANGFLGRHACELLERRGEPAIVVSRTPDRQFLQKFAPSLKVMDATEFDSPVGSDAITHARAIVYFTWRSVPATFAEEPSREVAANVQPAFGFFSRVAEISREAKIIFLSSGGTVYGRDGTDPKCETSPTQPISSYGLGKLMAEEALRFMGRYKDTPYAILRVSNAIGRWQTSEVQGIAGVALRAARDDVPVRLFGGGSQVRDFVDADDVAEAIVAASNHTSHNAATWNVGSGLGTSIIDLIHVASRVIGKPIALEHAPLRALDVSHIVLDCGKVARELGWTARTPLDDSIASLWRRIQETD